MKGKDLKRLLEITTDLHMLGFDTGLNSLDLRNRESIEALGEELIKVSKEMYEILSDYKATKNLRYMIRHNVRTNKF